MNLQPQGALLPTIEKELENETIMIAGLPKEIKPDLRQCWRISLPMIGLFTRNNNHSSWQCIEKKQWLFSGQKNI
ncbi:hypothetical protein PMIT1323_00217 [Prochlorococcus marinus str. MIT 1323]|nr:hypothetical protein PMIT1323_00217 [Prochlorococcus marinus str. MIT 1323]